MSPIYLTDIATVQHLNCVNGIVFTDLVIDLTNIYSDIVLFLLQESWMNSKGFPLISSQFELFTIQ